MWSIKKSLNLWPDFLPSLWCLCIIVNFLLSYFSGAGSSPPSRPLRRMLLLFCGSDEFCLPESVLYCLTCDSSVSPCVWEISSSSHRIFYSILGRIYFLIEKQVTEKQAFHPPFHSLSGCNSQEWVKLKAGVGNSSWVPHAGREVRHFTCSAACWGMLAGNWTGRGAS